MKKKFLSLYAIATIACFAFSACGGEKNAPTPPSTPNVGNPDDPKEPEKKASTLQVYLCIGQSNMYGSADIEEIDKEVPDRLLMMASTDHPKTGREMGKCYPAIPPLSNPNAGLCPADNFGRTMVQNLPDSVKVLLINVSVAGCDIRIFDKDLYEDYNGKNAEKWFKDLVAAYDGSPYHRLLRLAKFAMVQEKGTIEGIILHQGETNTGDKQWPNYVKKIYNDLLTDLQLKAEDVPILAGEMVHENMGGKCSAMNPIIRTLPETIPTAYVISSDGCTEKGDKVHFDSDGVRQLGRAYAVKMLEVKKFKK